MHSADVSFSVSPLSREIAANRESSAPVQVSHVAPVLSQPPLPPEPPPPAFVQPHQQYNHQANCLNQSWQNGSCVANNLDIPPISSLLLREADAWRAVLSLHASVVTSAQHSARSQENVNDASLEDRRLKTNSRESAYCSALSSLASQCDALFNEIMKLRAFRKARRTVEVDCANEIMRSHCDEILAIGQTLASNGALSVSAATAELRVAILAQKNQVSQLRVFLETLITASTLPLPAKSKLVVGVCVDGEESKTIDLDDVLKETYSKSRELTDASLSEALSRLFLHEVQPSTADQPSSRQFARRSANQLLEYWLQTSMPQVVRTVQDKELALSNRKEEQRNLGKHIDRLISEGQLSQESAAVGCGGSGLCPMIGRGVARFLGISQRVGPVYTDELRVVVEKAGDATEAKKSDGGEVTRAVFGLAPSKKKTPQSKLAAAAGSMKNRVESLEARAAQSRQTAQQLMKTGNKAAAMRELKRSKQLQKQAFSTQAAMDAIEAQSDMLEQTALQKEVAAAIGATAATLKKEKELISKAEDAVDAAAEMRDLSDDLSQVMAGLGEATSNDFDDQELILELEDMVGMDDDTASERPASVPISESVKEALEIERRDKEYEELEKSRQEFPVAPKSHVSVEKQGLLLASH